MVRRKAEQVEEVLQKAARGQPTERHRDLLETAQQVSTLSGPVPKPPELLAPGRHRLRSEAAQFRATRMNRRKELNRMRRPLKVGAALLAAILVFGFAWR
jgi:hypothetical protein